MQVKKNVNVIYTDKHILKVLIEVDKIIQMSKNKMCSFEKQWQKTKQNIMSN